MPGNPLTVAVRLRVSQADAAALELIRGDLSRSDWIRDLIRTEIARHGGLGHTEQVQVQPSHLDDAAETITVTNPVVPPTDPTAHRHLATTVATRTVKGVTVKTRACMICGETWET